MASLVADNFRVFAAEQFMESLEEPLDAAGNALADSSTEALRDRSKIYVFIGRSQTWNSERYSGQGFNDIDQIPAPTDSFDELSEIYDDMIAMKRVTRGDVNQVIRKRTWTVNTRYDMYKHNYSVAYQSATGANKLYDSQFYVMNSNYDIYKCIYNGETPTNPNGVISTVEPTGQSTSIFTTADSYRWKYMYTLGINDFVKFVSSDFMPVKTNTTVQTAATSGAVDQALVRNVGSGITAGTYFCPVIGDGTGAVVTFTVSSTAPTSGQIDPATVAMTVVGSGYTYGKIDLSESYTTLSAAQARTATPLDLTSGSPAIDAIISPPDGHGSDIVREMGAYRVMINKAVEFLDGGGDVPVNMEFRRFGLISDPKAPGGQDLTASTAAVCKAIKFPTATNVNYSIGETITQSTTGAKGVVIHWDSVNKILRYYQNEYVAATQSGNQQYQLVEFSGANAITGATSNTVLTPDTAATGTVTIAGISFTTGYAASEVQKFSGSILYIENRKTIIRSDDQTEDIKLVIEF